MTEMRRSPRNTFIAGGTSGINLAIAARFVAEGDNVTVLGRDRDRMNAAVRQLGGAARGFAADVRDADAVRAALDTTAENWGPIDVIVSGAAGNFTAPAAELSSNGDRKSVV